MSSKEFKTFCITGVAGFIGSNILETLLNAGHSVVGLDNFATGKQNNLDQAVSAENASRFKFIRGDIRDLDVCMEAISNVDAVIHQAAMGSVVNSIDAPLTANAINITGFLNMLEACRQSNVKRFVYATSSAVLGIDGKLQSPYAVTKHVNELYADMYHKYYGLEPIGLRYFNVYGMRQDPKGEYAAVIPKWINQLLQGDAITVYGDGLTTRDFCFINDVVKANWLAATTNSTKAINKVFNIASGRATELNQLAQTIVAQVRERGMTLPQDPIAYAAERQFDIKHSQADIAQSEMLLEYASSFMLSEGLNKTLDWMFETQASLSQSRTGKNSEYNRDSSTFEG